MASSKRPNSAMPSLAYSALRFSVAVGDLPDSQRFHIVDSQFEGPALHKPLEVPQVVAFIALVTCFL